MPPELTSETDLASQILVIVGQKPDARLPSFTAEELFHQATRKQLLDCAQTLGLTGVSKLVKEELAGRVKVAFDGLRAAPSPARRRRSANGSRPRRPRTAWPPSRPSSISGRTSTPRRCPSTSPGATDTTASRRWSIDPERLYVYWEVTDDAVAAARAGLGRGRRQRLAEPARLRHHRAPVRRHQRAQLLRPSGRAARSAVVLRHQQADLQRLRRGRPEVRRGLLRQDRPLRAGRVSRAASRCRGGAVEWLTVRATGEVRRHHHGGAAGQRRGGRRRATARRAPPAAGPARAARRRLGRLDGALRRASRLPGGHRVVGRRWEWQEPSGAEWTGELTADRMGRPARCAREWEAGPFTYPIEVPSSVVEVRDGGEMSVRTENGRVHVVYGPWQVVIRGLGARAERRVLGTWEYKRQVAVSGGFERFAALDGWTTVSRRPAARSGWRWAPASGPGWARASSVCGGASELWMLGASEIRLGGASELMYAGASERRMRGASETHVRRRQRAADARRRASSPTRAPASG